MLKGKYEIIKDENGKSDWGARIVPPTFPKIEIGESVEMHDASEKTHTRIIRKVLKRDENGSVVALEPRCTGVRHSDGAGS